MDTSTTTHTNAAGRCEHLLVDETAVLDYALKRVTLKRTSAASQERDQRLWRGAATALRAAAVQQRGVCPAYDDWTDDLYADLSAQLEDVA